MLRITLLFSLCFLLVTSLKAQTEKQILNELEIKEQLAAKYLEEGSTIEGIQITREIISLVEKLNDVEHKIKVYLSFVELNIKIADYEVCENYLQKTESLITAEKFKSHLLEVSILKVEIKLLQAEFNEALLIAKQNFSKVRFAEDTNQVIKTLSQIAIAHLHNHQYDSSLIYWNHLIFFGSETQPSKSLAEALQYKAFILIKLDRTDSVLTILNNSMIYAKQLDNLQLELEGLITLGHYYLEEGSLNESLKYLDLAHQLSKGKGLIHSNQSIASLYHQLFSKRENYKEALFWYKKNEILKDSLSSRDYKIQISNEKSKLLLQQKENELLMQTSRASNNQIIIIALSLGFLALILIFIMQRRLLVTRNKNSLILEDKNQEIEVQNKELAQQKNYLIDQNKYVNNRNTRLESFLNQLEQLTKSYHINKGNKHKAFQEICILTQDCLKVSRVSIWTFNSIDNSIKREIMIDEGTFTEMPGTYFEKDYPKYFSAIMNKIMVLANDVSSDDATSEFAEIYESMHIKSMIDASFLFNGKFAGIICCEQRNEQKIWDTMDTIFLKSLSDFISITLLSEQNLSHNKELKTINESLENTVNIRTSELEEQNNQLREYAFINSHLLRAPLARVLDLSFLISKEATSIKDKELISNLLGSTKELDQIVKNISDILYDGNNLTRDDILAMIGKKLDTTSNS